MSARLRAVICLALAACKGSTHTGAAPSGGTASIERAEPTPCNLPDLPWRLPAAKRLVAIGDLHGDAAAARKVLRLAGAIDEHDAWIGGDLVVVQLGDVLDRGDGEQDILDLFARLETDARAAGGSFVALLGNHELMNAAGDFRYVTPGGFADFADAPGVAQSTVDTRALPPEARARGAALFPGGPYAQRLAGHDVVVQIGDTIFAHGGVEPAWADPVRIETTNRLARCWLGGQGEQPDVLSAEDGPVWSRTFAGDAPDCAALARALHAVGASRMVIAHTVQPAGASSACDGAVWRIDVGLASIYGGPTQALEIDQAGARDAGGADEVRVLGARP
jgi:hypothetical protein